MQTATTGSKITFLFDMFYNTIYQTLCKILNAFLQFGDDLVKDAVKVFHRALKQIEQVTPIHRVDEMMKCRDNERRITFSPGKKVLNQIRKVTTIDP